MASEISATINKAAMKITKANVRTLAEGMHSDDTVSGLCIRVRNKSRTWIFRRSVSGKRFEIYLGTGDTDLKSVRADAMKYRAMTNDQFIEEIKRRKESKAGAETRTFAQVVSEYYEWSIQAGNFERGSSYDKKRFSVVRTHALKPLGKKLISEISAEDVAKVYLNIWDKQETIRKLGQQLRDIFNWSKARKYRSGDNPADSRGELKFMLPKKKKLEFQHYGALPLNRVADFCAALYAGKEEISHLLFLFAILTATRSKTVRYACWEDIDLENKIWTIDADDLKVSQNGLLKVPLSDQAIEILNLIGPQPAGYIFRSYYGCGSPFSENVFVNIVKRMNKRLAQEDQWIDVEQSEKLGIVVRASQHGISRSCFTTWGVGDVYGNDKRFDRALVEACMHHKLDDKYDGAYDRGAYLIRRREIMDAWGKFCWKKIDSNEENV